MERLKDIVDASDMLNITVLTKKVEKHFFFAITKYNFLMG